MSNLKIKSTIGIGDIIIIYSYFKTIEKIYDSLVYIPNTGLFNLRGPEYNIFIVDFFNWLKDNNKFEISLIEDPSAVNFNIKTCIGNPIEYLTPIDLSNKLFDKSDIIDEYICVNTKIRIDMSIQYNLEQFINTLSEMSSKYKIVIMGEKSIPSTWENDCLMQKNCITSIYNKLKTLDNVIDLTLEKELTLNPNLNQILNDLTVYKNAKLNINIGNGGNLILSGIVGKCVNMTAYLNFYNRLLFDSINVSDFNQFLNTIKTI